MVEKLKSIRKESNTKVASFEVMYSQFLTEKLGRNSVAGKPVIEDVAYFSNFKLISASKFHRLDSQNVLKVEKKKQLY